MAAPAGYAPLELRADWRPNIEHNEIFLLGERIYKTLGGERPYQGTHLYNSIEKTPVIPLHKKNPAIPRELGEVVMRMIAPSPRRYEVFTEIFSELGW